MSQQQSLFGLEAPAWEIDAASEQLVATVVFTGRVDRTFDYAVPDRLRDQLEPGRRVRVPFGPANRMAVGYCVAVET